MSVLGEKHFEIILNVAIKNSNELNEMVAS